MNNFETVWNRERMISGTVGDSKNELNTKALLPPITNRRELVILHGTQGPHLHFEIMKSTETRKGEARFPLLYNPGFYIDYRYGDKITELDIKQQLDEKNN